MCSITTTPFTDSRYRPAVRTVSPVSHHRSKCFTFAKIHTQIGCTHDEIDTYNVNTDVIVLLQNWSSREFVL